jgi:hypothetical protein
MSTDISPPSRWTFVFLPQFDHSLFKGKRLRKRLPFDVYPHILENNGEGKLVAHRSKNA